MNEDYDIGSKSARFDSNNGIKVGISLGEENNNGVQEDKCNDFDFIFREWIIFILDNLLDFRTVPINTGVVGVIIFRSLIHISHLYLLFPHFFLLLDQWCLCR